MTVCVETVANLPIPTAFYVKGNERSKTNQFE